MIKLDSCTGTLIADDWVITAAHCYSTLPKLEKYKNEFGDYEVINDAWSKSFCVKSNKLITSKFLQMRECLTFNALNVNIILSMIARKMLEDWKKIGKDWKKWLYTKLHL